MIAKGRYVGLIECDFEIDLGNEPFDLFQHILKHSLNAEIERRLKDHVSSDMKVTQQYLDVYQVEDKT